MRGIYKSDNYPKNLYEKWSDIDNNLLIIFYFIFNKLNTFSSKHPFINMMIGLNIYIKHKRGGEVWR